MAWSIIIPAIAILVSEFWLRKINYNDKAYIDYVAYQQKKTKEQIDNSDEAQAENKQGIRMIGVGIVVTGIIISVLGILGSTGKIFVISLGGVLTVLGGAIFFRFIKKSK
jgi:purine-cytosine permease-like protein